MKPTLVDSTVSEATRWRFGQFVDKVVTAVCHSNVVVPATYFVFPIVTDFACYSAVLL